MKTRSDGGLRSGAGQPDGLSSNRINPPTEAPPDVSCGDAAVPAELLAGISSPTSGQITEVCQAMVSSCGDSEGRAGHAACPSQPCAACAELIHELSNLMTAVLMHAQVLEWKLPPYSHLKRPVREVERNAQRGGELLKRLMRRCAEVGEGPPPGDESRTADAAAGIMDTVDDGPVGVPDRYLVANGNGCASPEFALDLTSSCDSGTSGIFPKRDDRSGRQESANRGRSAGLPKRGD